MINLFAICRGSCRLGWHLVTLFCLHYYEHVFVKDVDKNINWWCIFTLWNYLNTFKKLWKKKDCQIPFDQNVTFYIFAFDNVLRKLTDPMIFSNETDNFLKKSFFIILIITYIYISMSLLLRFKYNLFASWMMLKLNWNITWWRILPDKTMSD